MLHDEISADTGVQLNGGIEGGVLFPGVRSTTPWAWPWARWAWFGPASA
jgi:hypothetical protein